MRPKSPRPRRRAPARAATAIAVAAIAFALLPGAAPAVILHAASGKVLSYQPLRTAHRAATFDATYKNLEYNGGAVMPSNTNYAVYWQPEGAAAYPGEYQSGIDTYFQDLAHDSGMHANVDSVSAQYFDWEGDPARYESHFGGALVDKDAYPKSGCTRATICLTEEQLTAELAKFIEANGLPADLEHEYFLLTPPKVEDCITAGGLECSAGAKEHQRFCAYHSAFEAPTGVVVWANDPYVAGNFGCDDGNHPNGRPSDGEIEGGLSHEHNESLTDPEPASGWVDLEEAGGEIGDKCRGVGELQEFGKPLGTTGSGAKYNQVINGHFYWYQQEWSNEGRQCLQRWSPPGAPPAATFTSAPGSGTEMKFDATGSTAPGGVTRYDWKFADSASAEETTVPTITHKFIGSGKWEVALTVFAANGASAGTARVVETGDEGPTAAIADSTSTPASGQQVEFEAPGSSDPDGSIASYSWNFGDGSVASGFSAAHSYESAGVYTVTLNVVDSKGQRAAATRTVEVDETPTAAFSFQPSSATPGSAISFDASSSTDPDGAISSYSWTFGDGGAASGVAPEHAFAAAGAYTVTLTVTDSSGRSASASTEITVAPAPALGPSVPSPLAQLASKAGGFTAAAPVGTANGTITVVASVPAGGTFTWLATFANGKFGVFAARAAKCRSGFRVIRDRCRPSAVVFSKGREAVAAAGSVRLTLAPTRAARKALATARKHGRGVPVSVTVGFRPASGSAAVSHAFALVVRTRPHA